MTNPSDTVRAGSMGMFEREAAQATNDTHRHPRRKRSWTSRYEHDVSPDAGRISEGYQDILWIPAPALGDRKDVAYGNVSRAFALGDDETVVEQRDLLELSTVEEREDGDEEPRRQNTKWDLDDERRGEREGNDREGHAVLVAPVDG